MSVEVLTPLGLVLLIAALAPPWSIRRRWLSIALTLGYGVLVVRYLEWRLTDTVLGADVTGVGLAVVWVVFLVELLAWYETAVLILILMRRTDHSAIAHAHQARLQKSDPETLPDVDVFIATYNEPLDVLEKTIAGALALDWPRDRLHVHVLDDGRRDWLRDYCAARGVIHLTRGDNRHAKAGNINAALARTSSPFILVLDADFVPLQPMLMRAMGFFDDPAVGIVQMPHHFFNIDPVQTSFDHAADLPDEQRLFFDVIQPGRDGWDCAFCCGSNGILRRAAVEAIGGAMPTDSVTEDMLLSLAMLRMGYVTRYLNERLAIGLAPENLEAYFVQRGRWAQGAMQILYLDDGPFGPGLRPLQRLLFTPSHWITQALCHPVAMLLPAFFLLTGIPPILNATVDEIVFIQLPAVAASLALLQHLAPGKFGAILSTAQSILQAIRVAPMVFATLVKPTGHSFKVTPKGSAARQSAEDRFVLLVAFTAILATGYGLLINASPSTRIIAENELLPVVAFWGIVNMFILLLVAAIAIPRPILRGEERFAMRVPCRIVTEFGMAAAETCDISMSGALIQPVGDVSDLGLAREGWVGVDLPGIGLIPGRVIRVQGGAGGYGIAFELPSGDLRDRLIQALFSSGAASSARRAGRPVMLSLLILRRIFKKNLAVESGKRDPVPIPSRTVPQWLAAAAAQRAAHPNGGYERDLLPSHVLSTDRATARSG